MKQNNWNILIFPTLQISIIILCRYIMVSVTTMYHCLLFLHILFNYNQTFLWLFQFA